MIRGTQGYEEQAGELVERCEAIGFTGRHEAVAMAIRHGPVPSGRVTPA